MDEKEFENVNVFGKGKSNDAYAQYFIGKSYLNPLVDSNSSLFLANVTFEPGCRNNWHIHHARLTMELRDLYDENKELTGETIYKGQDVPKGRYYITVVVFIQNSKNEFLIQKRVKKKDGKWATTGGHPVSGETSKQGIITEIKEELGVDIVKENIKLFKTIKTQDDFVDFYFLKEDEDIKKIKIQKEEVEDVKWATIEEINELIKNEAFSESHTEFFELCLDYLKLK